MFRSPYPDIEIPDQTLYDYLFGGLVEVGLARTAIVDGPRMLAGEPAETSYAALIAQIDAVAGALAARGIGPGDVVALHAPNIPAFAVVFHGILRAGATATTLNVLSTGEEITAQLSDSGAALLCTTASLLAVARAGASAAGILDARTIVLDGAAGHESLDDLLSAALPAPAVMIDPATAVAVIPYSSGTTGRAKGVLLTHRNLVANVEQSKDLIDVVADDSVLAVLPFFHIYGMTVLLNLALKARARLVTMPRFDLDQFLTLIQETPVTFAFVAPPIAVALTKHPAVSKYDLSSLHTVLSGAAPLDAGVGRAVEQRIGCRMLQGYGMTEMSPISHLVPRHLAGVPLGSIGVPVPNMTMRLVHPQTGEDIPLPRSGRSEPGELLCSGPNVMAGYLGNEFATRETLTDDGYLHTGDLASVDADGNFFVVDRLKELIKYKGYQVAPAELEALLLSHPEIADAAVIGIEDGSGEEVPKAFVVVQGAHELTPDDVMAYVAVHVAPYKKVRAVEFVDAIPKSTSGKILRKDLRARAATVEPA